MNRFNSLFGSRKRNCATPVVPVVPASPTFQPMQMISPYSVLGQVAPLIRYSEAELARTNPTHAITECALIGYLQGLGFDFRTARAIVESWESDEVLLREGILLNDNIREKEESR